MTKFFFAVSMFVLTGVSGLGAERPNMIFILADDMGHGDVRALNAECKYPTPNLDRLAQNGIAFTQGYSGSSICTPTRYGLLTGRYCWRDNIGLAGSNAGRFLAKGQKTVASFLRDNGYRTFMVGKWHLGTSFTLKDGSVSEGRRGPADDQINWKADFHGGPVDHGFDYWFGIAGSLDFAPYVYLENRRAIEVPTEEVGYEVRGHRFGYRPGLADPDLMPEQVLGDFARKTSEIIRNYTSEKPFFLYLALNAPHSPVAPADRWRGKSGIGENGDFRMEVDWVVGEVMNALAKRDMLANTMIVFSADNGTAPNHHKDLVRAGHNTSDGRRGHKSTMFEGGHRVPYIVYWPEKIKAGQFSAELVTMEDFYATCADILGKPLPEDVADSVSFLPLTQGGKTEYSKRDVIVSSISGHLIVRRGRWKLICYPEDMAVAQLSEKTPEERDAFNAARKRFSREGFDLSKPPHENVILYDIVNDVAETTNVCRQNPEVVSTLARFAIESIQKGRTNRGEPIPTDLQYKALPLLEQLVQPH